MNPPPNQRHDPGILSEPIDLDPVPGPKRPAAFPKVEATPGLVIEHRASGIVGAFIRFDRGAIIVRDRHEKDQRLALRPGAFDIEGRRSTIVAPSAPASAATRLTTSGSVDPGRIAARVARPSRIMVEGLHDAELIEKVWGPDLRVEGIVVEVLHGMDDLGAVVADFGPGPGQRLGILLDHLVAGTKEQRAADLIDHPHVLICGHPYVDVWEGIRPGVVGIEAWPQVPMGIPWKEGVIGALGSTAESGRFWKQILAKVSSYRDLEMPLVGAVEQLIDFVADESAEP